MYLGYANANVSGHFKTSTPLLSSFINPFMRATIIAISLSLTQLYSFGQTATIKGVIQSKPGVTISFSFPEDPIKGSINVSEVTTDKSGAFTTIVKLDRKRPVRIDYNIPDTQNNPHPFANYLWIEPNKTLQITINAGSVLFYNGQCVNENNILKTIGLNGTVDYETKDSSFISFCKVIDNQKNGRLTKLLAASRKYKFSDEFLNYAKAEIFYYNYRHKFQFINNYPANDPSVFTSFLQSINLFSDKAFYSLKFRNGLREYFDILSMRNKKDTSESYTLRTFRLIDKELINHAKTKEFIKSYILRFGFAYEQNIDTLKEAIASIENDNINAKSLPYFYKKIDEKISLLYSEKKLPDVLLTDIEGKKVSLKNYEGKILFIDFWGSWCKPCMEEMPYSIKLHEELDSNKIIFIYINNPTDSYEKWVATIKKLGLKGINLKADTETQKALTDFYVFTNYPFYVVHDRTGKPINIEGGIRPSKNAKEVLTSLVDSEKNGH